MRQNNIAPISASHYLRKLKRLWRHVWVFSTYILFFGILGCSASLTGKSTIDNLSALDYAQQFAEHQKSGDLQKMVEAMFKARYRWFYEKECFPATEKGSRSPGVFMSAFIFATPWDAAPIESQPQLYAELLASMLDWQVAPSSKSTYQPGYPHRKAGYFTCDSKAKELQKAYSKTVKRQYNLMSNKEYQDVIGWIAKYEKLSEAEKVVSEKEYLLKIQLKGEIEGKYEPK